MALSAFPQNAVDVRPCGNFLPFERKPRPVRKIRKLAPRRAIILDCTWGDACGAIGGRGFRFQKTPPPPFIHLAVSYGWALETTDQFPACLSRRNRYRVSRGRLSPRKLTGASDARPGLAFF